MLRLPSGEIQSPSPNFWHLFNELRYTFCSSTQCSRNRIMAVCENVKKAFKKKKNGKKTLHIDILYSHPNDFKSTWVCRNASKSIAFFSRHTQESIINSSILIKLQIINDHYWVQLNELIIINFNLFLFSSFDCSFLLYKFKTLLLVVWYPSFK